MRRRIIFLTFRNIMHNNYSVDTESEINEIAKMVIKNCSKCWYLPENIDLESAKSIIESDEDKLDDIVADAAFSFSVAKSVGKDLSDFASTARKQVILALISLALTFSLSVIYALLNLVIPGITTFLLFVTCVYLLKLKIDLYGAALNSRYIALKALCEEAAIISANYDLEFSAMNFRCQLLFDKFGDDLFDDEDDYDDDYEDEEFFDENNEY